MTPTTPRESLISAITQYCRHMGKPTNDDVGCSDCTDIVDDALTALAPWLMEWRPIEEYKPEMGVVVFGFWTISNQGKYHWNTALLCLDEDGLLVTPDGDNFDDCAFEDLEGFVRLPQPPKVTE